MVCPPQKRGGWTQAFLI